MRTAFIMLALVGFAGLGITDLIGGNYATGAASLCLGAANTLLFWGAA